VAHDRIKNAAPAALENEGSGSRRKGRGAITFQPSDEILPFLHDKHDTFVLLHCKAHSMRVPLASSDIDIQNSTSVVIATWCHSNSLEVLQQHAMNIIATQLQPHSNNCAFSADA
jgi:hypothetical protein